MSSQNSFIQSVSQYGALGTAGTFTLSGATGVWDVPVQLSASTFNIIFLVSNYTSSTSPNMQLSFSTDGNTFHTVQAAQPQNNPGNFSISCYALNGSEWYSEASAGSPFPTVSSTNGVPTIVRFTPISGSNPQTIDTMTVAIYYQ